MNLKMFNSILNKRYRLCPGWATLTVSPGFLLPQCGQSLNTNHIQLLIYKHFSIPICKKASNSNENQPKIP